MEFVQLSHPGKRREHNQDCVGHAVPTSAARARSHGWLFVLADGVGGTKRGEVASRTAVEYMTAQFDRASPSEALSALLKRLAEEANVQIYETGRAHSPGGTSMATTMVACALRYDRAAVAHAGDSRCYLLRRARAQLLTRDHKATSDPSSRHVLRRSLGTDLFIKIEISAIQLYPGDVLLLCSDGLYHSVPSSEMAAVAANGGELNIAAQRLVDLANERDGSDNISVQLIRVRSVEPVGIYRGRPYKLR